MKHTPQRGAHSNNRVLPVFLRSIHRWITRCLGLALGAVAVLASAHAADIPRRLIFEYDTNRVTPGTVVHVFKALEVDTAADQWQHVGTVTNLATSNSFPVQVTLPQSYFKAFASNEYGTSFFSESVFGGVPGRPRSLRLIP